MQKPKGTICALIIVTSFLFSTLIFPITFTYKTNKSETVSPTIACESPNDAFIKNISVQTAFDMINKFNPLILDVRNSDDFELGHLFNAINIPFIELEERVTQLQDSKYKEIIVYCKTGFTSEMASNLLLLYGFKKIYNLVGGIQAWLESGYPISTNYHNVTVTKVCESKVFFNITPLIGLQGNCSSCNGNCNGSIFTENPENVNTKILVENDTYVVLLLSYDLKGVYHEALITYITRWINKEQSSEVNRTIKFSTIEIVGQNFSISYDSLIYLAEYKEFTLRLYSEFVPFENGYSHSFTYISVINNGTVLSEEFLEMKIPVKLSELYTVLGIISEKMSKIYGDYLKKSNETKFRTLIIGYQQMKIECFKLSKVIQRNIPEYDLEISQSHAILSDPPWWICAGASFVCGFLIGYLVTCAVAAAFTGGAALVACIGSVLAAVGAGLGILTTCTTLCCCLGYSVCC